jgi:hypothetical protein
MKLCKLTAYTFPYDRVHDLYQEYYRSALRSFCEANGIEYRERSGAYSSSCLIKLRGVRHSYKLRTLMKHKPVCSLVDGIAGLLTRGSLRPPCSIGIYEIATSEGETITVAIDSLDTGEICSDVAASCTLYFKSNYWPRQRYPDNVVPLPNMNPLVGREIRLFHELRDTPKTTDMFAFFRIWGGTNELDGVEHNLSLIESLAQVPCSKYLCAYLVAGDIPTLGKRLDRQGIRWTTEPMPKHELWRRAASSRVNIVRLGMHECSPWRMIDILAMGGCPVIDYGPQTRWPIPLLEGRHYLNLRIPPDAPQRSSVSGEILEWLTTPGLVDGISRNTAEYFDRHLRPVVLGEHMVTQMAAVQARQVAADFVSVA